MITITVDGHELRLYKDTTLNLELNNALFSADAIEGDVCYGFDIPISGNELPLQFSHTAYAEGARTFACLIAVDGLAAIAGRLIVRQSGFDRLSVDVVCNPYPDGWPAQSVRDDFSETVAVSRSYPEHRQAWKAFLKESAAEDSDIKFGLHFNGSNYGNGNASFGFWNGQDRQKLVNRLYLDASGNVADGIDTPFIRLFNELKTLQGDGDSTAEMNQFCFCPQIRLVKAVRQVLESSGYQVGGSFFSDPVLQNVFIQSATALDGSKFQYAGSVDDTRLNGEYSDDNDPRYSRTVYIRRDTYGEWHYSTQGGNRQWQQTAPGSRCFGARLDTLLQWNNIVNQLPPVPFGTVAADGINNSRGNITFSAGGTYSVSATVQLPHFEWDYYSLPVRLMFCKGTPAGDDDSNIILFADKNLQRGGSRTISITGTFDVSNAELADVYSVQCVYKNGSGTYRSLPAQGSVHIQMTSLGEADPLNIFAKEFEVNRCLPDMSNSSFINAVRKAFGLTFYIDALSKRIEISAAKDLTDAAALDLTPWLLGEETEIEFENKRATFRYTGMEAAEDVDGGKLIEPVYTLADLPDAHANIGKVCLVRSMNALYISEREESGADNWRHVWNRYCYNPERLTAGSTEADSEEIASDAQVPCISPYRDTDGIGNKSAIPDIPLDIESPMLNETVSDKLVLLYYRGKQRLYFRGRKWWFEQMAPYSDGEPSLSAASIGSGYVQPWLDLYTSGKTATFKFRMPAAKMMETARLLQPQDGGMPVRWIQAGSVRALPRRISFQVDSGDGKVLCEIEAALLSF